MKVAKNPIQTKLEQAIALQNAGDAKKASALFLQVLKAQPDNIFALYSLAAIESNLGNDATAINYANRAVTLNPQFAPSRFARSVILSKLGQFEEALTEVDAALALGPDLSGAQAHKDAVLIARKAGIPPVPVGGGPAAQDNSRALQLQGQGRLEEAEYAFLAIVAKHPQDFVALYSLGVIASRRGDSERAYEWLAKAAQTNPDNAMAQYAMATALQAMALYEQAQEAFDRALQIDPNYIEAYNNKATLYHSMNRHLEALQTLEAGLAVAPQDHKLLNNKGYILTEFKQNAMAANVFQHLLNLNPDYEYAQGLHMLARLHSCDWTNYEENKQRIIEGVRAGKRVCNPFAMMAITDNAEDHYRCAGIFGEHRFPGANQPMWRGEKYRHRKKRVAFLSADFREHPVGYLLIGLIENLKGPRIETYGFSLGIQDGSELYRRYRNGFDHYLDCKDKTSHEIARLMRAMEIDIVIDLSGYTSGSRLDVLSHRPCPAQATYLGFPGGLNLPYVDYLIADRVTVPESLQPYYREKLLYLPHCYLPRDTSVKPSPDTPRRADFALPDDGLVFCSFNHDYKINPPMFSVWMDLMRENPKSVLWLMKLNEDAQKNLAASANAYDIDPARLVFATRVPRIEDHLARYRLADICLDTFPYNGHTTTSDAILAGVPVVTLAGQGFASRVAASLLSDAEKRESVSSSLKAYSEMVRAHLEETTRSNGVSEWSVTEQEQADGFVTVLDSIE
jgi:predicted O-linked N-acetylglucosamine transferase (SPINDLY family)